MAIKETLNNTVKYSGATEFRLQIRRHRHNLSVIVQDNGRGFDPSSVRPGRHGLGNISRRMQELGGSCRIVSEAGQGCRIELSIPLRSPRRLSLWWNRRPGPQPKPTETSPDSKPAGDSAKV
jgi:signal transduction histidine kinase